MRAPNASATRTRQSLHLPAPESATHTRAPTAGFVCSHNLTHTHRGCPTTGWAACIAAADNLTHKNCADSAVCGGPRCARHMVPESPAARCQLLPQLNGVPGSWGEGADTPKPMGSMPLATELVSSNLSLLYRMYVGGPTRPPICDRCLRRSQQHIGKSTCHNLAPCTRPDARASSTRVLAPSTRLSLFPVCPCDLQRGPRSSALALCPCKDIPWDTASHCNLTPVFCRKGRRVTGSGAGCRCVVIPGVWAV
jgi:hypothetical protein